MCIYVNTEYWSKHSFKDYSHAPPPNWNSSKKLPLISWFFKSVNFGCVYVINYGLTHVNIKNGSCGKLTNSFTIHKILVYNSMNEITE